LRAGMEACEVTGRGPLGAHLGSAGTHSGSLGGQRRQHRRVGRRLAATAAAAAAVVAEAAVRPRLDTHEIDQETTDALSRSADGSSDCD
jgi:hypothetical protein